MTPTDELRAAALRIKESAETWLAEQACLDDFDRDSELEAHWRDQVACADVVLAGHHADDGERIDAKWLQSVGFSRHMQPAACNDLSLHHGPGVFVCYYPGRNPNDLDRWGVCGEWLPQCLAPHTRGDVRRLLAALGVEIRKT